MVDEEVKIESRHYSATFNSVRKFVDIKLHGLWTVQITNDYEQVLRESLKGLVRRGCPMGEQLTLIDLTDFPVQPGDVAVILESFAADQSIAPRRCALVMDRMLLKLQARRVAPNYALFDNRDDAQTWLFKAPDV